MLAITEYEQQDWVKLLSQEGNVQHRKKAHLNPNVVFPFQDDFSVGTIHGANAKPSTPNTAMAATAIEVVEIQDNNDNVNVLPSKTMSKPQSEVAVGS